MGEVRSYPLYVVYMMQDGDKPSCIIWTHDVWRQIVQSQGNSKEINRLFNLLPAIEAYIEDIIGFQLARGLIHDTPNILQDQFVSRFKQTTGRQRKSYSSHLYYNKCVQRQKSTAISYH